MNHLNRLSSMKNEDVVKDLAKEGKTVVEGRSLVLKKEFMEAIFSTFTY